ncbi:FAD-binding oxidoreductase [Cryptosporangium sp. NPDC048952]|uniref:FAD-binding oxidoreductase n=1 Tax=Cryptosporangium sp. NPDC048952 TaxID=3363961 RepID=UPI003719ADC7
MTESGLDALHQALGLAGLLRPPQDFGRYETSPNRRTGRAAAVIRPRTVPDVRTVLGICQEHGLRVVAQGANSGLVGGALPDITGTQAVLSTERMRDRFELDEDSRVLTASAGWTLDEINTRLAGHGLKLPVEVGSSPSVGGMVSTNTAGSNVLRYGDVRRRLLGVQVVVADDERTVIDTLSPLRKQNEGLDVGQLFIGTEGTYGVVTAATFELAVLPASRATAWLEIRDPARLPEILREFERRTGEWLTAFELASPSAVRLLEAHHSHLLRRVPTTDHDCVLVEIGAADESAQDLLLAAIEALTENDAVAGTVVGDPNALWEVRHTIPLITEAMTPVISFDISTSRSALTALRKSLATKLAQAYPSVLPIELGHYGDGGLHYILPLPGDPADEDALRRMVLDTVVHDFGGSFAAEHGIGPKNSDAYDRYVPAAVRDIARLFKRHFDPHDILGWRANS